MLKYRGVQGVAGRIIDASREAELQLRAEGVVEGPYCVQSTSIELPCLERQSNG